MVSRTEELVVESCGACRAVDDAASGGDATPEPAREKARLETVRLS
ncbi:MAG: hypothetical protein M3327_12680 [Actinomycetota bacterium]|jgi:hypothetical protein|nr:hypothetical protein [Actinomycetota bacterium]